MKVAIAGYGIEGESNYRYYSSDPANVVVIADQKVPDKPIPQGADTIIGDDAFERLQDFDLVVRTASLAPNKIKTNGKVWSSTNEFFSKCPCQIIGVTGTKGKGTTASLIASIFEAAGKKVWLLGNIGKPALETLNQIQADDIVVYELSSFQLWDLGYSPHVAVVLLVEPEHLDIHYDFDDYINAKSNIRRYQKSDDLCLIHPTNQHSKRISGVSDKGVIQRYGVPDDGGVFVSSGNFCQGEHIICAVADLHLIGPHNVENACAAISVARFYDVLDEDIKQGIADFKGLPHRIEFVRDVGGVKYYNDSFSSAVPATVAAINSFSQPEILIVGGIDRGGDFSEVADTISKHDNVKAVIIMGEIRDKLMRVLSAEDSGTQLVLTDLTSMDAIVELASSYAEPGDVVVLSPGCASFDMFKDFYDRGDQFREVVSNL